jgi:hypothetical protein
VKFLLAIPGMSSERVSAGLKVPPLFVLSTAFEREAMEMQASLEKFGAVCEIENTDAIHAYNSGHTETVPSAKVDYNHKFVYILTAILILFIGIIYYFFSYNKYEIKVNQIQVEIDNLFDNPSNFNPSNLFSVVKKAENINSTKNKNQADVFDSKDNKDLKKELVKNPYNDSIWKILYENLEKEGDSIAARAAKESYNKAVKAQQILHNLAKAFGKNVQVEIKENTINYRVKKELTDNEFYEEAVKLRKSLNARFPGKDLIIENYGSSNVQSVTIKAERETQPKENDSPK